MATGATSLSFVAPVGALAASTSTARRLRPLCAAKPSSSSSSSSSSSPSPSSSSSSSSSSYSSSASTRLQRPRLVRPAARARPTYRPPSDRGSPPPARQQEQHREHEQEQSLRINKCLASRFSRREADLLVAAGRVLVNGVPAVPGARVRRGDTVTLDGSPVAVTVPPVVPASGIGPPLSLSSSSSSSSDSYLLPSSSPSATSPPAYLKLHKPLHVGCVDNPEAETGVLAELRRTGWAGAGRVFPVGHLDPASSGVVLLTSDGRLVHAAMGARRSAPSECVVRTHPRLPDDHVQGLRRILREHGRGRPRPSPASSASAVLADGDDGDYDSSKNSAVLREADAGAVPGASTAQDVIDRSLRVTFAHGRPRGIRKLLARLPGDYVVESIHRVSYMGIDIAGIEEPGTWASLNCAELNIVDKCLRGEGFPQLHDAPVVVCGSSSL